jgi:hypothetical protein
MNDDEFWTVFKKIVLHCQFVSFSSSERSKA